MNNVLRDKVEYQQMSHPATGRLHELLLDCRFVLLEFAFPEWQEAGKEVPLISLDAERRNGMGIWRAKFQEIGPLGFTNVISINLLSFHRGDNIPKTLAHEMCHWWDRPNTGHGESFYQLLHDRVGLDPNDHMTSMTWSNIHDHLPMTELHDIILHDRQFAEQS